VYSRRIYAGGGSSAWVAGTIYAAGALVSAGGKKLPMQCPGYEPNTEKFGGAFNFRPATASASVTPVYTVGGACPATYASATYSAGSKVTTVTAGGKNVYQCKAFPYSGYCSQAGYVPLTHMIA